MIMAMAAMCSETNKRNKPKQGRPIDFDNLPRPKGMNPFIIEGIEVWALNEKNAKRKAKKIKR
jgi:hypothetical protein